MYFQITMKTTSAHGHPEFVVNSIIPPGARRPVTRTINCGSKADIAQVDLLCCDIGVLL